MRLDILKKLGVNSFLDLNESERESYRSWEQALSGRRLTDEDVKEFLTREVEETISKLTTKKLKEREDTFLKMKLEFTRSLQRFLNSPIIEVEAAKRQLEATINLNTG